ncbi:MAG TPA: long-chain fatty acid--CoA ligase, partial [bacterium]
PLIEQILIIGDKRKFISALIVPNFEMIKNYAEENKIQYQNEAELVQNQKINQLISNEINRLSADLARYEQIKAFRLLPKMFTIQEGELTPTIKIKRKVVEQKFADLIESMYQD